MPPIRVVEKLDVVENVRACVVSGLVDLPFDALGLQQREEALGYGVVVTIAPSTHAGFQVVVVEKFAPIAAGVLDTLIRMNQHSLLWLATPNSHQQGVDDQIRPWIVLHAPTDDLA